MSKKRQGNSGLAALIAEIDKQRAASPSVYDKGLSVVKATKKAVMAQSRRTKSSKLAPPMEREIIQEVIDRIEPGTVFDIQFNERDVADTRYLRLMLNIGFYEVENMLVLAAVSSSGKWEFPENRIFRLTAKNTWKSYKASFKDRFLRRLEAITIIR